MWCEFHKLDSCKECHKTTFAHQAHGLCKRCASREWYRQKMGFQPAKSGWSLYYEQCIECRSINNRYESNGLCCKCYSRNRRRKQSNFSPAKSGWSNRYEECLICKTQDIKYQGKGLCKRCYTAKYRAEHPEKFKEHPILLKNKQAIVSLPCKVCNSSLYVEAHHILPEKFLRDKGVLDPIIIHSINNLLPLCKTHHRIDRTCFDFFHKELPEELWRQINGHYKNRKRS